MEEAIQAVLEHRGVHDRWIMEQLTRLREEAPRLYRQRCEQNQLEALTEVGGESAAPDFALLPEEEGEEEDEPSSPPLAWATADA